MSPSLTRSAGSIRPARITEAPALKELAMRASSHWGYDAAMLDFIRAFVRMTPERIETQVVRILELDGRALGFYELHPELPTGELNKLFVDTGSIRRGCGTRLWDDAIDEALQRGVRDLIIHSDPHAVGFNAARGATYLYDEDIGAPDPAFVLHVMRAPVLPVAR